MQAAFPAKQSFTSAFVRVLCVLFFLTFLGLLTPAQAQLVTIAYEGFNYPAAQLEGQNGGTGWTSPWVVDYGTDGYAGSFYVSSTSLTYPGLSTSGGSIYWNYGGISGISENARALARQSSGVIYVQFLSQLQDGGSGYGTPTIRLYDGTTMTAALGGNGGDYGNYVSILNGDLEAAPDGSSSTTALLNNLNLIIARIDYMLEATSLWVNPDLSTFNYLSPGTPDAIYSGLAPSFDSIAIYSRDPAAADEFSIFAVPEPATGWLLAAGLLSLLRRRSFMRS